MQQKSLTRGFQICIFGIVATQHVQRSEKPNPQLIILGAKNVQRPRTSY